MFNKTCTACEIPKPLEAFYSNKRNADGKMHFCIPCTKRKQAKYRAANRAKLANKGKARYYADLERSRANAITQRKNNGDSIRAREKLWRDENRERVLPVRRVQTRKKYHENKEALALPYIRCLINRNAPVYLRKEKLPVVLLEAVQLEMKIKQQLGKSNGRT